MSGIYQSFLKQEALIRRVIARYVKRPDDIEDLAQEAFLRSFAAERTVVIRNPDAFLVRVARNLALSEVKKKVNSATDYIEDSQQPEVMMVDSSPSGEERLDGQRKLLVFTKAVASLPAEYQQTLLMRKVEHLKVKQIATRLGVSISTVEKRIATALLLCSAYLRENGYDLKEFGAEHLQEKAPALKPKVAKLNLPSSENRDESNSC